MLHVLKYTALGPEFDHKLLKKSSRILL
jgi:hypothetical protein